MSTLHGGQDETHAAGRGYAGAGWRQLLELDRDAGARVQLLDLVADRAGERLEQPERRAGAERDHDLADLPVVDRVRDPVGGRGGRERQLDRQVDAKPAG